MRLEPSPVAKLGRDYLGSHVPTLIISTFVVGRHEVSYVATLIYWPEATRGLSSFASEAREN